MTKFNNVEYVCNLCGTTAIAPAAGWRHLKVVDLDSERPGFGGRYLGTDIDICYECFKAEVPTLWDKIARWFLKRI